MEKGIAKVSTSNAYLRNEIASEQGKNYKKKYLIQPQRYV
jgi:hypothetical protein